MRCTNSTWLRHAKSLLAAAVLLSSGCTRPIPAADPQFVAEWMSAATVLTSLLGPVAFEDSTNMAIGHAPRRYASFQEAADVAAQSRLYGGIHFPMGTRMARCSAAALAT